MDILILVLLGGLLLVGFVGGLVGGRIGRSARSVGEDIARIEARLASLHLAQDTLAQRVAQLEAGAAHAMPPTPAAAPAQVDDMAAAAAAAPQPAATLSATRPPALNLPDASPPPPPPQAEARPALELDLELPPAAPAPAASARAAADPALPRPTPLPQPPDLGQAALPDWLQRLLFGGNTVVRAGVVILFFGVAFLLKYAWERVEVPIELRLTGVVIGAIAMLVLGWRLRERRSGYALALQGGGVGLLYLTVFAALRLYQLLPAPAAFALLAGIAVFSGVLALLQNGRSLAILGTCGGFLAPLLASTGSGNHVLLFGYYAVLNAGVLALAWQRAWRELNLLGFVFTFAIGALWGARYYRPEFFASVEPFLLLYFLMYLAVPIGYALRRSAADAADGTARLPRYLDASLVFGTPLIAFGLQLALVRDFEYGAAFSALALGALYLVLARHLWRRAGQRLRLLVEAFYALGVVFATLAIPLAFEGRWTAAAWALEAAAILWIGVRQGRLPARLFAVALQLGAGLIFLTDLPGGGTLPLLNAQFMGCAFVGLGGLFCAWYLERHREALHPFEAVVAQVLLVWGLCWWAAGGMLQIAHHAGWTLRANLGLLYLGASCTALALFARRTGWGSGASASLLAGPAMALGALTTLDNPRNPLAALGWLAWPAILAAHLLVLRLHAVRHPALGGWLHALGVWVVGLVGALALARGIDQVVEGASAWSMVGIALLPGALLAGLASLRSERWPFGPQRRDYLLRGGAPLAAFLILWSQLANWLHDGRADPLPYVPLVNPLELALAGALLLSLWWLNGLRGRKLVECSPEALRNTVIVVAALTFALANGSLLRTLHHYADIPWEMGQMLTSRLVQAALSIFWTLIAMGVMVFATRRAERGAWFAGAALMGVVVIKLFTVDLSNIGGIERVVSFIGVGVLMLVIGWFAPAPPKTAGTPP